LLVIILLIKSTAFTQPTSNDSIKCFTIEQVKQITKDLKKGFICDSIVQNQELQIVNFRDVLKVNDNIIVENNKRVLELTISVNNKQTKIDALKKVSLFGIPVAIGGGLFLGILLSK